MEHGYHHATLKKKFVSCPAGGRNCGQLSGHIIFCVFLFCNKIMILEGGGGMAKKKNFALITKSPVSVRVFFLFEKGRNLINLGF